MPGLQEITNITYQNLTSIANLSSPSDFFINVNNDIYGGFLYFILLIILWFIMGKAHYDFSRSKGEDDMLVSIFESGAVVTLASFLLRGIEIYQEGVVRGLLSDYQMWTFPLITVSIGLVIYSTSR